MDKVINKETHSVVMNSEGNPVIADNSVLLWDTNTCEVIYVPLNKDVVEQFNIQLSEMKPRQIEPRPSTSTALPSAASIMQEDQKVWTNENTLYLIDCVQNFQEEFSCGVKKNVWQKVSDSCKHLHKNITAKQCETKWKSLIRTYKTILLNNNTSGQKKRYWEYYDLLHSIMYNKPEISPIATCSSLKGLNTVVIDKETDQSENETENKKVSNSYQSSFSKKRKQKLSEAEKRHREKMQRVDRFNELFEKMISKMPDK